ncbi:MAG: winged helix-turn-helix transcriptional regulator [Thermoplasmata archaeon]|nr:winged helix-turn-helix transcriptional regulator [Thermoplasmata archaeon]
MHVKNMKIFRDLKESTTVLILLEITTRRHTRLKTIAEKLGITVQGVSEYLRRMTKSGLVVNAKGEYRATNKGVELLHQQFLDIKDFVDDSMKKLEIVDVCTAIAGSDLRVGNEVGLFMEKGILKAYPNRKSKSMGTATFNAKKGEDVGIRNLEGIVALRPGKLHIVELPISRLGGSRKVSLKKAKELILKSDVDRFAALDLTAFSLLKKVNVKCDIEFAVTEASIEALQKGLDVMVLGTEDEVYRFVSSVNEFNAGTPRKIRYRIVSLC